MPIVGWVERSDTHHSRPPPQKTTVPQPTYILASEFTEKLAPFLLVLGVVMIGFLILMSIRGKIANKNRRTPSPREHIENLKTAHQSREDVNVIKADMYSTAQELASKLTTRARHLEILIDQADQRIAALTELERSQSTPTTTPPLNPSPSPSSVQSSAPIPSPPPSAITASPSPQKLMVGDDPLSQSIYGLADSGNSALEIAQQLDEQIGKVELILALRAH